MDKNKKKLLLIFLIGLISTVLIFSQDKPKGLKMDYASPKSIRKNGITWYFKESVIYGKYINGDFWVLGPVIIEKIEPASTIYNGRYINGSMLDPEGGVLEQGYDSGSQYGGWDKSTDVAYELDENNPLYLYAGSSLISSRSSFDIPLGTHSVLEDSAILTVVDSIPPDNSFRPPFTGNKDDFEFEWDDVDTSYLMNTGLDSVPSVLLWGEVESSLKRARSAEHIPSHNRRPLAPYYSYNAYGRNFTATHTDAILMLLFDDISFELKKQSLIYLLQIGIDMSGIHNDWVENNRENPWGSPGSGAGRKLVILFTAKMFNEYNLLESIRDLPYDAENAYYEDSQTFIVTQDDIDYTESNEWNPDYRADGTQQYDSTMIGMPEWAGGHLSNPYTMNAHWGDTYRGVYYTMWIQALIARVLNLESYWNHEAFFLYANRYVNLNMNGFDPYGYEVEGQNSIRYHYGSNLAEEVIEEYWDDFF